MPQFLQVMNKYHLPGMRSKEKMDMREIVLFRPADYHRELTGRVILTRTVKKFAVDFQTASTESNCKNASVDCEVVLFGNAGCPSGQGGKGKRRECESTRAACTLSFQISIHQPKELSSNFDPLR